MKRIFVTIALVALLVATIGTAEAIAKERQPAGKSSVYQYDVKIDPAGSGKFVMNAKQQTFVFNGKGCSPGTTYYLYYTSGGTREDLGSVVADSYGKLYMSGACSASVGELGSIAVTATPKFQAFCQATYTVVVNNPTMMWVNAQGSWTGETGVVTHMVLKVTDDLGREIVSSDVSDQNGVTQPQTTAPVVIPQATVKVPLTGSITVWDSAGNVATATSQAVPG